jgi:hypothetical protein
MSIRVRDKVRVKGAGGFLIRELEMRNDRRGGGMLNGGDVDGLCWGPFHDYFF